MIFNVGYDENGKITITKGNNPENVKPIREFKGSSKLDLLNNYVVLDLETTGYDPRFDDIIEIGAIKVTNGEITDTFSSLVNPQCEISEFIAEHTGITNDMVQSAPKLEDVLQSLLSFIGYSCVVGHNVSFDINILYDRCFDILSKPFSNNFIDTLRLSRRLFKDCENHKLSTLINKFNLGGTVEHRSMSDCMCINNLYTFIKSYVTENNIDLSSLLAKRHSRPPRAGDIGTSILEFDESHPLYDKVCVFTGALENFTRTQAMQIVSDLGGINADGVTKKTNYLILGNNDYCSQIKEGKSRKQKKAEEYILLGCDLMILSEKSFYEML